MTSKRPSASPDWTLESDSEVPTTRGPTIHSEPSIAVLIGGPEGHPGPILGNVEPHSPAEAEKEIPLPKSVDFPGFASRHSRIWGFAQRRFSEWPSCTRHA